MLSNKFSDIDSGNNHVDLLLDERCCVFQDKLRPRKKQQVGETDTAFMAEIVAEISDRNRNLVPICALLDSVATESTVSRKHMHKGRAKSHKGECTMQKTLGVVFLTNQKALLDFKFPELSKNKAVTWIFHADLATLKNKAMCGVIVVPDLMAKIGAHIDAKDKNVHWEGSTVSSRHRGELGNQEKLHQTHAACTAPPALAEAKEH